MHFLQYRSIRSFSVFVFSLVALLCIPAVFAQTPRVLAPHTPIAPRITDSRVKQFPPTLRSMVGGFWRINPSSRASIYIRNGLDNSPLTVTPILYLSNGARYSLSPVTLRPLGTAVVSINKSLEAQGIAPYAELSGYVEVEYSWAWDALCVSVSSFDPIHSLIFTYSLQPAAIPDTPTSLTRLKAAGGMNMIESLWWKPTSAATGFVAISNTAEQTSTATLQLTGSAGQILEEETAQISPHGTKTITLQALQTNSTGATGGLHIIYSGQAENTVVSGGIEDDQTGFSANLPFHAFAPSQADPSQASEESYAELGLMTGEADPMMHFPSGTVFTPFSVVRNVGQQTLSVTPSFYWMAAGQPRSAALDPFTIAPSQSLSLDIPSLLSKAGLAQWSGSVNLILDAHGPQRSLLLAAGSVDSKNTYVFQIMPQGIQDSQAKSISYWSTANGDDTMLTVWNPADEAQDFLLTFNFESGHYRLPVHLGPRATQTLNISDLIKSNLPDDEGNTIPASVTEGSATLSGSQAENQEILAALDAGTYNANKAICRYYCISCDGTIHVYVAANPFAVAQGGQNQLVLMAQQHSGGAYSIGASWSSNHTNIATVSSSGGLVTGVSVGAVTMTANASHTPWYNSYYCAYDPYCPYYGSGSGQSSGSVTLAFTVGYNAYIPVDHITGPTTCTWSGGLSPNYIYMGDGNRGTYRSVESIQVTPDLNQAVGFFQDTGQSKNYGVGSPANGTTLSNLDEDGIGNDCYLWNATGKATPAFSYDVTYPAAHQAQVHYSGSVSNPLETSLATIQWDMRTVVDTTNPQSPTGYVNYSHTCYPAHQIKVNGSIIYSYQPLANDPDYLFQCLTLHAGTVQGQTSPIGVPAH